MYTARRRAQIIFTNARDLASFKGARLGTDITSKLMGATVDPIQLPRPSNEIPSDVGAFPSATEIMDIALHDIMSYIQSLNPGPTIASRLIYVWFMSITAAYNWVSPTAQKHIENIHDGWNWSTRNVIQSNLMNYIYSWITYALTELMPMFITGYNPAPLFEKERAALKITTEQQNARHIIVRNLGKWDDFWTTWSAWYTLRNNDGRLVAAIPPSSSELPNGENVLNVEETVDPSSWPRPDAWTPLKVGIKTQKYLTYNWNDVRSSCLTTDDESSIKTAAMAHYVTGAARASEIDEVVTITNQLTDTQKMIAEFWAGGPGSVSPPCIAVVMWSLFIKAYSATKLVSYDMYFFSGLEMCIHVFEAGRLIWGLKKQVIQARPIQEIRARYRGQILKNGFGNNVLGELWVPFQESNFVTPPFADFPSGHSGFSQVFSEVMTRWFGEIIPTTVQLNQVDLSLISPVLADTTQLTFPTFIMPAGESRIQPGIPSMPVTLTWSRWQDMADSAGISRKYGGIHASSAHVGSQALGRTLHTFITNRWGIKRSV